VDLRDFLILVEDHGGRFFLDGERIRIDGSDHVPQELLEVAKLNRSLLKAWLKTRDEAFRLADLIDGRGLKSKLPEFEALAKRCAGLELLPLQEKEVEK